MLCLILIGFVLYTPQEIQKETTSYTPQEVVETRQLDIDYSLLYTCKPTIYNVNPDIVEVSYIDAVLLMKVARAEGGATLDGQLWSMRTIINRIYSNDFPDSVQDVVEEDGQFEVVITGSYINADVNSNTHIALAMIEGGWDETQGALYFESSSNSSKSWHKTHLTFIKEVEGQRYYK